MIQFTCEGLYLSVEQSAIDEATDVLNNASEDERKEGMESVNKNLKQAARKIHAGKASPSVRNDFAADAVLWYAYSLMTKKEELH